MKKVKYALGVVSLFILLLTVVAFAGGPNYATTSHPTIFTYSGYVQIQSSYNDGGRHAARGRFTYRNGMYGTQTYYTAWGSSMYDSSIHSKSATYYDSLDPTAPVVTFNYNFNYVPRDQALAGVWPV